MNLGMILLGIWLLLTGLVALFALAIPYQQPVMGLLALVAGIIIIAKS